MNQHQSQGQPAGNGGQAVPLAGAQARLYRPEAIRGIHLLNEIEKTKYEQGLRQLWTAYENLPKESPEGLHAKSRIIEFSRNLQMKLHQRKIAQTNQANQVPPNPSTAGPNATVGTAPAPAGVPPTATDAPTLASNSVAPQQSAQQIKIPEHIRKHVSQMTFHPPPGFAAGKGPEAAQKYSADLRKRYVGSLMTMDQSRGRVQQMESIVKDRQDKGGAFTQEEMKQYQQKKENLQREYQVASKFVDNVRKQQEAMNKGNAANATGSAARPPNGGPAAASNMGNASGVNIAGAGNVGSAALQNPHAVTATVNAAVEAAKNQQVTGVPRGTAPGANGAHTQPQKHPHTPVTSQPSSTSNSQAQPSQLPKSQQPHPPPVNTAVASAAAGSQLPSAGTPTQGSTRIQAPQSAPTPVTAGPGVQRLSMSAAVSLANQRISQPASAPMPATSISSPANSAMGNGANSQQGHPHAHPTQTSLQSKMSIPKLLPDKATQVPQPAASMGGAGAGRPTYNSGTGTVGGVMSQPILSKVQVPQYVHEAEGEHVLSKKKLDELVRQVCGGTADGQEGNLLSVEVEENVLLMADAFVDNVLHTACRIAKERGSKVLEIRDIQLVLERTYNIRVPGYSSDELRTVRKVQPSAAWIAKMSAVQAAKVTGKGE